MKKNKLYILGFITLVLFPIPAYLYNYWVHSTSLYDFLEFENIKIPSILAGGVFGISYAIFALFMMKIPLYQKIPLKIDELVRSLNLTYTDAIFLSLCAGIGEELLFRSGVQDLLGIWLTSLLFVAIHGYFSVRKPLMNLYGILVLPFILIIGYCYEWFGLWMVVSAHAFYDLTLFIALIKDKNPHHRTVINTIHLENTEITENTKQPEAE